MSHGVKHLVISLLIWTAVSVAIGGAYWLAESNRRSSVEPLHRSNIISPNRVDNDDHASTNNTTAWPKIVWLMSFPNSGTSFTLRLVQLLTNQTTGTNYGQELVDDERTQILVREDWKHGPVRSVPSKSLRTRYILTKTHCGGRCVSCGPDRYLENYRSFQQACARGDRHHGNQTFFTVDYDPNIVSKAVHLIRNPFDNIVSRFHLSWQQQQPLPKYAFNRTGFQSWCREMDKQYRDMERGIRWIDDRLLGLFRNVPCHAEFFKYIQWHNLATITITETMQLDHMLLYYEDYDEPQQQQPITQQATAKKLASRMATNRKAPPSTTPRQVQALMNFLQVPEPDWNAAPLFDPRTYVDTFYTAEQRQSVRLLVEELATVTTWQLLQRYF